VCNCGYCSGLKTNVSNFFGVDNDDTMAKWQDRVQHMHATSRLIGRGYKPSDAGETPESAFMLSAVPGTAPAFNQQLTTPYVRDPFRR